MSAEEMAEMQNLTEEAMKSGALVLTGGFAILQASSREEAVERVKAFLKIAGDGECELHQLMEPGGPR